MEIDLITFSEQEKRFISSLKEINFYNSQLAIELFSSKYNAIPSLEWHEFLYSTSTMYACLVDFCFLALKKRTTIK